MKMVTPAIRLSGSLSGVGRRTSLALAVALLAGMVGLAGCEQPRQYTPPARSAVPFSSVIIQNTRGRVGYHMNSMVGIYQDDEPTSACSGHVGAHGMSYTGELPPGLKQVGGAGELFGFAGTPRQAGDWRVTITVSYFWCKVGPDTKRYGPRTIDASFHIDP